SEINQILEDLRHRLDHLEVVVPVVVGLKAATSAFGQVVDGRVLDLRVEQLSGIRVQGSIESGSPRRDGRIGARLPILRRSQGISDRIPGVPYVGPARDRLNAANLISPGEQVGVLA